MRCWREVDSAEVIPQMTTDGDMGDYKHQCAQMRHKLFANEIWWWQMYGRSINLRDIRTTELAWTIGCNYPLKWGLPQRVDAEHRLDAGCNYPLKWGLPQPARRINWSMVRCNYPLKWGLPQPIWNIGQPQKSCNYLLKWGLPQHGFGAGFLSNS